MQKLAFGQLTAVETANQRRQNVGGVGLTLFTATIDQIEKVFTEFIYSRFSGFTCSRD